MDADFKRYLDDPSLLAQRGVLNRIEHAVILAAVQTFEGVVRGFLLLLLHIAAPKLLDRALAAAATPSASEEAAQHPSTGETPQLRFVLAPPAPPRLDRIAGLLGETQPCAEWRVSFRFFATARRPALDYVSASYRLRLEADPHAAERARLHTAAGAIAVYALPALPLARRIEAGRRALADPRGVLARIIQSLHRRPARLIDQPPRFADPADDRSSFPNGPTSDQILAIAGDLIAGDPARLPVLSGLDTS